MCFFVFFWCQANSVVDVEGEQEHLPDCWKWSVFHGGMGYGKLPTTWNWILVEAKVWDMQWNFHSAFTSASHLNLDKIFLFMCVFLKIIIAVKVNTEDSQLISKLSRITITIFIYYFVQTTRLFTFSCNCNKGLYSRLCIKAGYASLWNQSIVCVTEPACFVAKSQV